MHVVLHEIEGIVPKLYSWTRCEALEDKDLLKILTDPGGFLEDLIDKDLLKILIRILSKIFEMILQDPHKFHKDPTGS